MQIPVALVNPYEMATKGELVRKASVAGLTGFEDGIPKTLSCAKLDGRLYKGGNSNRHCGWCVPCIGRRASVIAAGLEDKTPYLAHELVGVALQKLRANRSGDIAAVRTTVGRPLDESDVLALGPFPPGYDLDAVIALCDRGLEELAVVPL